MSGPTGALNVVVFGIVRQFGYEGLATATFIALRSTLHQTVAARPLRDAA
ncbi:MAG: hypothetical protein IPF53_01050 [Blastocatellia bacterium]|nr:hypothetical protein [Blastocatellia bacterium]